MSIEKTGPAAYEFQYGATLMVALRYLDQEDTQVVVEQESGEDFTIIQGPDPATATRVECQVKSSDADVGLDLLADWLFHYPKHSAENPLAVRIAREPQSLALFLAGGRCTDELRGLLARLGAPLEPHDNAPFGRNREARVREALRGTGVAADASKLKQQRADQRARLAWSSEELDCLARRVLIIEQLTKERIRRETLDILRTKRIPSSYAGDVVRALDDVITRARDRRGDCLAEIRRVIQERAEPRISGAVPDFGRPEADALYQEVCDSGLLLLTGQGQCGKTHLARVLAQRFQDAGHQVTKVSDVEEAARFLRRDDADERLCLLDDPPLKPDDPRAWRSLVALVEGAAPHRRVIVTSRIESLRLARGADRTAWRVNGKNWKDLTVRDSVESVRYWDRFSAGMGVEESARIRFGEYLQKMDAGFVLQPGQLRYLARNPPAAFDAAEWERVARFEARDLAVEIGASPIWKAFAALGLAATHLRAVGREHLAFVLSEAEERPGEEPDSEVKGVTLGGGMPPPVPTFPTYAVAPLLASEDAAALDSLERRGIVVCSADGVSFAHPDFQEAARILIADLPTGAATWVLGAAARAIGSLAPGAAATAVRVLQTLYPKSESQARLEAIIQRFMASQRSIFPEVRDVGLRALVEILPKLDGVQREDVLRRCEYFYAESEEILWRDGRPWLNPQEWHTQWRSVLEGLGPHEAAQALPGPEAIVSPEQAWRAVQHTRDPNIIARCFQFDEVFIRRRAAERLCAIGPSAHRELLKRALSDDGAVVAGVLSRGIEHWSEYEEPCRAELTAHLVDAVSRETAAVAVAPILWRFYHRVPHDDPSGEADLWRLWGALFPPVIRVVGAYGWAVDEAKLDYVTDKARPHLEPGAAWEVATAWEQWALRRLQQTTPRGEALELAKYVLKLTGADAASRSGWIARLLRSRYTALSAVSLTTCLSYWESLNGEERNEVLETVGGARRDAAWLQAVALTWNPLPGAVAQLLTGSEGGVAQGPEALRNAIPGRVLRRCIWIQTHRSTLFGWLGLGGGAKSPPWDGLLSVLRADPGAEEFDDVWAHELENPEPESSLAQFRALFAAAKPELRARLFRCLLDSTLRVVASETAAYWNVVWDLGTEQERASYAKEAMRHAERLSSNNHQFEPFQDDRIVIAFMNELPDDRAVLMLAQSARQVGLASSEKANSPERKELRAKLGPSVAAIAREGGLRTLWALDAAAALATMSGNGEAERVVREARTRWFERLRVEREGDEQFLGGWVFKPEP